MSGAYYNEVDSNAANWLRALIKAGLIADGEVDQRDIRTVEPDDLDGFTQCHFFAGIGVWSYALRKAGWEDSEPVWTGSCPCQPFSAAGLGMGQADTRHVWPEWWRLIEVCRPSVVFGEQVSSADALAWLDDVQANMESAGYAFAPMDICAAGVGAPHLRQRLYFVADATSSRQGRAKDAGANRGHEKADGSRSVKPERDSAPRTVADSHGGGCAAIPRQPRMRNAGVQSEGIGRDTSDLRTLSTVGDTEHAGRDKPKREPSEQGGNGAEGRLPDGAGATNGFWRDAEWIFCRDGKWRAVESRTSPLAYGLPISLGKMQPEVQKLAEVAGLSKNTLTVAKSFRVVSVGGYGNALNAQCAIEFIGSFRDIKGL